MANNYVNKQDIIKDVINKYSQNFWIPKNITTLKNNKSFGIADHYSYVENIDDHFIKQLKIPLISKDKETKLMQTQKIFLSFNNKQIEDCQNMINDNYKQINQFIEKLKKSQISKKINKITIKKYLNNTKHQIINSTQQTYVGNNYKKEHTQIHILDYAIFEAVKNINANIKMLLKGNINYFEMKTRTMENANIKIEKAGISEDGIYRSVFGKVKGIYIENGKKSS